MEPVLSLVTGHASLLYYSCTLHIRTPYASWLLENRFSVDPALTYHFSFSTSPLLSLLLSFSLDRWPPASYTKTTGFLFSRRRFAMRSWFLSRAVKMHVSCINPFIELVLLLSLQNNLLLLIVNFSLHQCMMITRNDLHF